MDWELTYETGHFWHSFFIDNIAKTVHFYADFNDPYRNV